MHLENQKHMWMTVIGVGEVLYVFINIFDSD